MDKVRARLAEQFDCPLYTALAVLGGRWKPLILWHLAEDGPQRFLALQRTLQGVPKKVLSQQLKEMAASGIITKIDFATKAPHTEYRITAYGRTVRPVLDALCDWGEAHLRRDAKRWSLNEPEGSNLRTGPRERRLLASRA